MTALTVQDHLGGFLKKASGNKRKSIPGLSEEGKINEAKELAQKISQEAKELGVEAKEYFHLITAYFRADSGAYTVDAGGQKSLDFLFKEETPPDCTRAFSENTQHNYDILLKEVKSLSTPA